MLIGTLINPRFLVVMDILPIILIIGGRLVLWTVNKVLVVTTHQKVIGPHLRANWLDMDL